MAIAFRAAATNTFSASVSPSVNAPAGLTDGDLIIITFGADSNFAFDSITGWTQAGTVQTDGASDTSTAILYKIASSEGASWAFTNLFAAAESGIIAAIAYSGVDNTTPFDVTVVQGTNTQSASHAAGPITPTSNGCAIVAIFGADSPSGQSGTEDDSPAATERLDVDNSGAGYLFVEDYTQETAAEISLDMTLSTSDSTVWMIAALRPAAAGGSIVPVIMAQL